jgi:cold shock protein
MVEVNGPQKVCARGFLLTLADSCGRTAFVSNGMRPPVRDAAVIHAPWIDTSSRHGEVHDTGNREVVRPNQGVGFLSVDGSEQDVFVHFSAIEADDARSLDKNRRVEFDIIQGERTRQAAHVRYI